jgi:glycosyltransferase involved in cell wall biosynthesis
MTIDIMMPFWGDVDQLRSAVASVLAQTDPDWRLTVIDDLYPGTAHIEYLASIDDPRVKVLRNHENLGVAGNFQHSVDLVTAEYCVIMGCDDVMLPGYVERAHLLFATHPEAAYVMPGVEVIDDEGRATLPLADRVKGYYRPRGTGVRTLRGEDLARSLLRGNWTYFPAICWRSSTIREHGFRTEYEVVLDLALQFEIAVSGGVFVFDDVVAFQYRRHQASVSSAAAVEGGRFAEEGAFFAQAATVAAGRGWKRAARSARMHLSSRLHALSLVPGALRSGNRAGLRILSAYASGRALRPDQAIGR